jgi:PBSX family phage terminase large subunit
MSVASIQRIAAPELRGASLELGYCRDREVCLDGPAGTGKTVGALYKIHRLLSKYPGSRALVARKTNTALAGSAMVTYRGNILKGRPDIHWFGGNKIEPAAFKYSNGSEMIVNGLDKPEKVQSAEFDWAYINEATECTLVDIEFVRMRLRPRTDGPAVPYRQLVMDCNPSAPTHWLNTRMNEGLTTRLLSRHEHNPRYFDLKTNDWTEEGREYIDGILGGLTGVRLARYRYGIWAAAEGTVYEDSWDRNRNVIDPFPIPQSWPRYMAVDFGYTHPFVCLWAAQDPDGRLYAYRQIYRTKMLVEDHAKVIKAVSKWGMRDGDPLPRAIICDHDAEDRATLERHLGLMTIPAQKNVSAGIQAFASRLRAAGDDKPRFAIFRDCLLERDRDLANAKQPTCLEDEPESYVWDTRQGMKSGEQPVKEHDHGLDAGRYLVAHFDLKPTNVRYSSRIY